MVARTNPGCESKALSSGEEVSLYCWYVKAEELSHMACVCDVITVDEYFDCMEELHRLLYEEFERGREYGEKKEKDIWTW